MKIAVIGTGGVGGYYGGLLAQQGHAVTFVARGAHLEAIRKNGLQIKSVHGNFTITPTRTAESPAEIGPVDLVLFCIKTYDTARAAEAILYDREVRLYATFLARAAQGVVLMLLPEACYLSGPIASALPKESWKTFAKEFIRHPVHGELLGQVQLGLVREPELALKGAELEGVRLAEAGGGAA